MNKWNCRKQTPEGEWLVDQEYVRNEYVLHQYLKYAPKTKTIEVKTKIQTMRQKVATDTFVSRNKTAL